MCVCVHACETERKYVCEREKESERKRCNWGNVKSLKIVMKRKQNLLANPHEIHPI